MRVLRYRLSQLTPGVIDGLVANRFFASRGFAEVWRGKGGRPVVWVARDGGQAAAILPGVEFGRGPLCRFMSMPDGCYGGIFFAREFTDDRERVARLLLDAIVRRRYVKTFLFDFYDSVPRDPRFETILCATTLVDISGPDWRPPDKKLMSQIRKAEREGIGIEQFDWSKHASQLLRLVRASQRRHGRELGYPPAFFEALAELARRDDRVQWLWCRHNGKPVCSHIYFMEHGVLQGWQKHVNREFSFLKADQYIRFTMCRKMAGLGVARLNLGATPNGAVGLAYYKRRWGGEPFYYNCYALKRGIGRLL